MIPPHHHLISMSLKSALIAALAIAGATASNTRLRAPESIADCPKKNGEEEGRVLDCKKGRYCAAVYVFLFEPCFVLPH